MSIKISSLPVPLVLFDGKLEVVAIDYEAQKLYITIKFTQESYDEAVKSPGLVMEKLSKAQEYMRFEGWIPQNEPDWAPQVGIIIEEKKL